MSELTQELPKEVITAWRRFLGTNEGQFGIDWLRRNNVRLKGETDMQMLRAAARNEGYWEALDDIEDRLTKLPVIQRSLEEAPLALPGRDE
jgi:hypothetical protein